ncbi:MAG: P1 family peptidase [Pseudomonadota bacterium]
MRPGPRNLITDVPGLRVGNARDEALKTGTTVVTADSPFIASCHVMGGAPGTRETDLLAPDKTVDAINALVLSGGSAFGLDACSGVAERLRAEGRGYAASKARVPIVPGAILFDLFDGQEKGWTQNPYAAMGAAAFDGASEDFALGTEGAGTGALSAMLKGGLGSASLQIDGGAMVGALVAANPVGSVTTPGDRHFYAAPFEIDGEFGGLGPDPNGAHGLTLESRKAKVARVAQNTVIAIVATDARLTKAQCHRMATAAHDGIARACVPAHTPLDGDIVFGLSYGAKEADPLMVGHAAALCLSRAIARAVFCARETPGDKLPCWKTLNG